MRNRWDHSRVDKAAASAADLAGLPLVGLRRGTRLGRAVHGSFEQAGVPYMPTVEVRYRNTVCVLATAGVGVSVVDPFFPLQGGHPLAVRPFRRTIGLAVSKLIAAMVAKGTAKNSRNMAVAGATSQAACGAAFCPAMPFIAYLKPSSQRP